MSTPKAITTPAGGIQPTDTYCQIIPGISEHLYPTFTADGSLSTLASDDCSTLHKQITSKIDQYLQEAAESMKQKIITLMGDTCRLIHQLLNKKPTT